MALKKKPKEKEKSKRLGKDEATGVRASSTKTPAPRAKPKKKAAAKKTSAKKVAARKTAAKKADAGEMEAVGGSAKPLKKRVGVTRRAGQEEAGEAKPQQDPFEIARQTMKGSVPAIVEAMVELAKQGSCSHAKTLLEMTGARHMFEDEAQGHDVGEPWAKLVLERLGEAESLDEQEIIGQETPSEEMMEQ